MGSYRRRHPSRFRRTNICSMAALRRQTGKGRKKFDSHFEKNFQFLHFLVRKKFCTSQYRNVLASPCVCKHATTQNQKTTCLTHECSNFIYKQILNTIATISREVYSLMCYSKCPLSALTLADDPRRQKN